MVSLQHTHTSPHQVPEPSPMSSPLQGRSVRCLGSHSSLVKLREDRLGTRQERIR